jgi:tetratricopeptide (TPR) repeat protein
VRASACEGECLWQIGIAIQWGALPGDPRPPLQAALALFRQLGDREWEGTVLNALSIVDTNLAHQRSLYEQALGALTAAGSRERQAAVIYNLAILYQALGMYRRAAESAEQLAQMRRVSVAMAAYALGTLASCRLYLGDIAGARTAAEQAIPRVEALGEPRTSAGSLAVRGQVELADGEAEAAAQYFASSAAAFAELHMADQADALAWLGAARLAGGDAPAALAATTDSIRELQKHGGSAGEGSTATVWWWRYQSLRKMATPGPAGTASESDESQGASGQASAHDVFAGKAPSLPAWLALDRARLSMLERVTGLDNDGLRRNYLNKDPINRQIVETWLAAAQELAISPEPLTSALSGPGGGEEQFRRLLDIGVRLNQDRDAANLPQRILAARTPSWPCMTQTPARSPGPTSSRAANTCRCRPSPSAPA